MPFITRCPHADCRKFNLVDNAHEGKQVRCLVCNRAMAALPVSPADAPPPSPQRASSAAQAPPAAAPPPPRQPAAKKAQPLPPAADNFVVRQCPDCGSKLRIPQAAAGRKVKCQKCGCVFS